MVRRRGDKGFLPISRGQATEFIADKLRESDPKRIAWYITSRGLTNEAYYAHQKIAGSSAPIMSIPALASVMRRVPRD
jgi:hypothetical protein